MTETSPQEPTTRRDRLPTGDEWIAVFISLATMGFIVYFSICAKGSQICHASLRVAFQPLLVPQTETPSQEAQPPAATSQEDAIEDAPGGLPEGGLSEGDRPVPVPSPNQGVSAETEPQSTEPTPQPQQSSPESQGFSVGAQGGSELPVASLPPIKPPAQFSDLSQDYWARPFIDALTQRDIVSGYPEGTYRPDSPVTRAELAAQIQKVFNRQPTNPDLQFSDIPEGFWGQEAIAQSVRIGFMKGYPEGTFAPERNISRVEVLVALVTGLGLQPTRPPQETLAYFEDASAIPAWAVSKVAAAREAGLVVGFPNPKLLRPTEATSRAELAVMIHQALVKAGEAEAIASEYLAPTP